MDYIKRRIKSCNSEAELRSVFCDIYAQTLQSRDYYNGALVSFGRNPYDTRTQQWGSESGTSFDAFMTEVTEITRNARLGLKLKNSI